MKKASFVCPGCGLPFDMDVRDNFDLEDAEHPLCWNCVRAKLPSQLPQGFDVGDRVLVVANGSEVEMVVVRARVGRLADSSIAPPRPSDEPMLELKLVTTLSHVRPSAAVKP
jgi:hypothetical protein